MILGIDIGSTTTKFVLMENNEIIDYQIRNLGVVVDEEDILKMVEEFKNGKNVEKTVRNNFV